LQAVDLQAPVPFDGLTGDGQLVPGSAVDLSLVVLDARLGAGGRVGVPADLELEQLQGGADAGREQVVQDL
jgi:hypothetical protein